MKTRHADHGMKKYLPLTGCLILVLFWFLLPSASTLSPMSRHGILSISGSEYETMEDFRVGEQEEEVDPEIPELDTFDPKNPRYITIIPGFGPNNQYLGLKDVMYIAKLTGRGLGRPDFWTHAIDKLNSIRPFEKTFDEKRISEYLPTVSLKEYSKICGGVIDTIVWSRPQAHWRRVVDMWLVHTNMTAKKELHVEQTLHMNSERIIKNYFKQFQDQKCLAFAFPFRNVAETPERKSVAKYIERAQWMVDIGKKVYQEMGVTSLLAIHWRWGEDSCGWWTSPAPHTDWEFCWGTSLFHFAHLDNVLASLKNIIVEKKVSTVYIAVSSLFHDKKVLKRITAFMLEQNVKLVVGKDQLTTLNDINDNYYLSLIEQEICEKSTTFIWSSDSTWSDFIVNHNDMVKGPLETISFAKLLSKYDYPYTTWNRVNDVPKLNEYKRT